MNVPFYDLDPAGIAHFSKVFCYAEEAEHRALADCGLTVSIGGFLWPRISATAEFHHPFHLDDEITRYAYLTKIGISTLFWGIELHNQEQLCATCTFICARRHQSGEKAAFTEQEIAQLQPLLKEK